MSPPFMPLYVADYLSATEHLDAAQSGAYLHLIMHYWQKGELPSEDKFLARIARMTPRQWVSAKDVLKSFFFDGWRHDRIESELEVYRIKSEARATYGKLGGESKALKDKEARLAKATYLPQQTPSKDPSKTMPSSSELREEELASANSSEKSLKRTARTVLLECLSAEIADGVIAHRKAKKAPLTVLAAEGLSKAFNSTGDPEDAARVMVARGWQGFKLSWYEDDKSDGRNRNGKGSVQAAARDHAERGISFGALPRSPDVSAWLSRKEGGDPSRMLPEGRRRGAGDLRSLSGGGLELLPGVGGGKGD